MFAAGSGIRHVNSNVDLLRESPLLTAVEKAFRICSRVASRKAVVGQSWEPHNHTQTLPMSSAHPTLLPTVDLMKASSHSPAALLLCT